MRSLSLAQAKSQLSALLDAVEAGEEVEITRRGVPVARLTRADKGMVPAFDLEGFLAPVTEQSFHAGDSSAWIQEFRSEARY